MNQNIHVLSRAVVIDKGQILLCKTIALNPDFFFLPGGHIEQGESAQQALLRELREESGFNFSIRRFLGCFEHSFELGKNSICHSHECNLIFEATSEELKIGQSLAQVEDHIELHWFPLCNLKDIDLRPEPLGTFLSLWLSKDMNDAFQSHML